MQSNVDDAESVLTQVEVVAEPDSLGPGLIELFEATEQQSPLYGLDWFRLFAATVMRGSGGVRFVKLARAGQPLAAMAINVDPRRQHLGVSVGALSNYYSTEFKPALARSVTGVDLTPMMRVLRRESDAHPVLRFAPMDPQSREYAALQVGLQTAGYAVFQYFCHGNWYLPVQEPWAAYLAQRPGELRTTLARKRKRLLADGGSIEIASAGADVECCIAAYQQVYARSWKHPEPVPDFMPELIRLCARRGWMRMGIAWLGQLPIAAQLWVVAHGRAAIYKLAYDEDYKQHAAGTVLTGQLMQHVLDVDQVNEVDYLTGDDAYKQQWMTHRRERWGLVAYDLHTVRGCAGALRQWASEKLRRPARLPAKP